MVKYDILLLSAVETKLLNNIISHAVIKFYTYFACCFNYRQLFWALLSDRDRFSASVPRHPETSTSPVGLYSAGLTNQCAWGSVSDLHACAGFRSSKKVEKHCSTQYPILLSPADTNTQCQYRYRLLATFPARARMRSEVCCATCASQTVLTKH